MFDILVYLFENFYEFNEFGIRPDADALTRKLTAAGFADDEITEALEWLGGLKAERPEQRHQADPRAMRLYTDEESRQLGQECLGFLFFLEGSGVLSPELRELVVDRAMALPDDRLYLSRFKVIVLMVLWSQDQDLDTLIIEELLSDAEPAQLH